MQVTGFAIYFEGTENAADRIRKLLQRYIKDTTIERVEWLRETYQINFGRISPRQFMDICMLTEKIVTIVRWDMNFDTSRNDCLTLLQERGFRKYEELDCVDINDTRKSVKISVLKLKGNNYRVTVQKFNLESPANSRYSLAVFKRIFEIIGWQRGG